MSKRASRLLLGVLLLGATAGGRTANAQGTPSGAASAAPAATNPYMNPYMNPLLNPALTVGTTNRNDALLYLWAAQQQPGGLLAPSGPGARSARQPSGGLLAKGGPGAGSSQGRPAEMPRSAMQPGGGASRYFNRTSAAQVGGTGQNYQRYNRYFQHNGR